MMSDERAQTCRVTYQVDFVVREEGLGLLGVDAGMDNNVLALLPVDRRGDAVLVPELDRVDCTDNFILHTAALAVAWGSEGGTHEVAAGDCRVRDCETDDLLRVNDEDGPDLRRARLAE